ncbi:DUF6603 domain-containing protein, partial [Streptomyces buecherae]
LRQRPLPQDVEELVGGLLVVKAPQVSFLAAGMYAQLRGGRVSVFVIGRASGLAIALGPVLLTGLVGGLGYNSQLVLPAQPEQVPSHPLLASELPVGKGPVEVLKYLGEKVRPAAGQLWLAAGAEFGLYKTVQAQAVVVVQVSASDATVAVLALAAAQFPQQGKPYACLTLGMQALYRVATGEIAVLGALDPARSYLVHPDCRVQGGFALCTWVPPSPQVGDFVFTLGGYHPAYRRPEHYPVVPRLGFAWSAGDAVSVRGECYAAVTPSMVMVGGKLKVAYAAGRVKAWLEAHLDAAVQWEPLTYDVSLGVRVGAEISYCGTHRVELGATLHLWGPPTAGVCQVHLPLVPDITVRFGEQQRTRPRPLSWPAFHSTVLAGQQPQATVSDGLLPQTVKGGTRQTGGGREPVAVSTEGFTAIARTPVPCTQVRIRKSAKHTDLAPGGQGRAVGLRPMAEKDADTPCVVTLKQGSQVVDLTDRSAWRVRVIHDRLPAAVFGAPLQGGEGPSPYGDGEVLGPVLVGLRLVCAEPEIKAGDALDPVDKSRLDAGKGPRVAMPVSGWWRPVGPEPKPGCRDAVAAAVRATAEQRLDLLQEWSRHGIELGGDQPPQDDLTSYADRLFSLLPADPLLVSVP